MEMGIDERKMLGRKIREYREGLDLTREELAVAIGNGSKQYVSSIENGAKNVTIDVLCRIASSLKVRVGDLITFQVEILSPPGGGIASCMPGRPRKPPAFS